MRKYFNSRPRAGGDHNGGDHGLRPIHISIHAPARGATFAKITGLCHASQFQFTPPRGGRRVTHWMHLPAPHFNSRPRAGGDLSPPRLLHLLPSISIHAPARGATRQGARVRLQGDYFNSRPRAGGDSTRRRMRRPPSIFQFTPPRGGRRHYDLHCFDYQRISIHAPARGATSRRRIRPTPRKNFNSRPRAGGDLFILPSLRLCGDFNSRPRAGGDVRF